MSSKQMKKLIIIIVSLIVVVAGVFLTLFFVDFESLGGTGDIETVKAEGNYETLKMDILENFPAFRDSQVANVADTIFEDIGVTSYEYMSKQESRRGNLAIYCDGYKFDAYVIAGELANAYIGNILVYKNPDVASVTVANAPELTYSQYKNLVRSFKKGLGIEEEQTAKDLYAQLTMMDVNSFTDIKKETVNGVSGFIGYEGNLPYFIVLDSLDNLKNLYIYCDGFDLIEIYNASTAKGTETSNTYKMVHGSRVGIPDSLEYRLSQTTGKTVVLPAALNSGDDSWLMVKYNGEIYLETRCEIGEAGKLKAQDIIIRLRDEDREILYLKIGKDVYIGG